MQYHQHAELRLAQPEFFILASLVTEPKTATAWYEAVMQAIEQGIEPGAFSRMVTRLERRGWIEALRTEHPLRLYQITAPGLLAIERAETQQHKAKLQEGWYPDWRTGTEIIMRLVL